MPTKRAACCNFKDCFEPTMKRRRTPPKHITRHAWAKHLRLTAKLKKGGRR